MDIPENNTLFEKIRLIETRDIELKTSADEFRKLFTKKVREPRGGGLRLTRPEKEFQGKIKRKTFKIYRILRVAETDPVAASGIYSDSSEKLQIRLSVYILWEYFCVASLFMLAIDTICIYLTVTEENFADNAFFVVPILLLFLSITIFAPYLLFKRQIKRLMYDLEREFHLWAK